MCDNVFVVPNYYLKDKLNKAGCTEAVDMHITDASSGGPEPGSEPCRFPKLEECAHFHYERVQLPRLSVTIQTNMDQSLHSQHSHDDGEWHMLQVTSGEECWLLQRNLENFRMLDSQLHQCIYDRKISQLPDLSSPAVAARLQEAAESDDDAVERALAAYLERFCEIADNSINCGPVLNWLQMDNKGHRLLVPSEESRSINTPAVAAAYSVRRYVSQARDELNLEVGDMISVIDMASPGESIWWRGKRGFQVGFFPQHCVHIIGDKVPRNMPLPAPVVGSLALSPIKPVLRKHGKLIAFFRSFILNRPSRRRLKQSGILKERVFGCDLGEHLLNSGHEIPMVLKCCAEFIETHGIVDGIYRLSGVTSNIQKLRNAFDEDRIPNLYTEDILQDIHSVASLLKMYFRELPNPLCTYQLYQSFVNAVQGCNTSVRNSETDHERLLKMREAVQKLPPPHYRTLEYLMRHLARVAKHGHSTGMTTRNVAIVWAPNLLRCAELEVGGVAALQGVGVQAVVTEFLICYTDLIFCDNLPNLDRPSILMEAAASSPKRSRPKSLAISTPTKLITLEEARSKHLLNKDCGYIEVGGGPDSLPKKYHTIIELPHGARKRGLAKRSPSGWRSFFTKSRNASQGALGKPRKASTPGIAIAEKAVTESDLLLDMKRKLRSVKSAESLTSGHSEPATNDIDILGPLHCLNKPPGHNRSVSHDSYFDTLQSSHNNSEGSLLDLSEIQLNFDLEESEMHIFSEDESLVSSPRMPKDTNQRRLLSRPRHDEFLSANNSTNPSPKKQPRVVLSPESMSRKRTRLEDQLSDIQFIDCNTPDNANPCTLATTAVVHIEKPDECTTDSYQPRNKSPRNSEIPDVRLEKSKRQSLNLEGSSNNNTVSIPKSLTEVDIGQRLEVQSTTSTPLSPIYKPLIDSSSTTTPGDYSPSVEVIYQKLNKSPGDLKVKTFDLLSSPTKKSAPKSPTYENVLTTISITYKSPTKSVKTPTPSDSVYEDVEISQNPSPTVQHAKNNDVRPKSFNDIETLHKTPPTKTETEIDALFANLKSTIDNNSLTDLSLSEVLNSSSEYLHSNRTSVSLPLTPTRGTLSPNVSPTEAPDTLSQDLLTPSSLSMSKNASLNASKDSLKDHEQSASTPLDKTSESPLVLNDEDSEIDSFPKCDTTLSELYETYDQLARQNSGNWEGVLYENVAGGEVIATDGKKCDIYDDVNAATYENVEFGNKGDVFCGSKPLKGETQNKPLIMDGVEFGNKSNHINENVSKSNESVEFKSKPLEKVEFGSNSSVLEFENNPVVEFGSNSNILKDVDPNILENENNISEKVDFKNQMENVGFMKNTNIMENVEFRNKPTVLEIVSDRPKSINLIEFSPLVENVNEKRKQAETTDSAIYQQVKYYRRSVHEINALLDLEKNSEQVVPDTNAEMSVEMSNAENFDSLENDNAHIYENCETNVYENIDFSSDSLETTKNEDPSELVNVKNLTSKFETKDDKPKLPNFDIDEQAQIRRSKKFKDGLPPCLRARNLKNAIKTRSLDEEEFRKEFDTHNLSRRKSLDENINYNINTLPKSLNKPKILPGEDPEMQVVHLAHSIESVHENPNITTSNSNLNRERIEKYKEERRKFFNDKYRSESFKEDKDVLLSRFKIFKPKEEEDKELLLSKFKDEEDVLITRIKAYKGDDKLKDERDILHGKDNPQIRLKDEKDILHSRFRNEKDNVQASFKDDKDIMQSRINKDSFKNDFLQSRFKDDKDIIQSRFKDDKDILQMKFKECKDVSRSRNKFCKKDEDFNFSDSKRKSNESLKVEDPVKEESVLLRSPKTSSIRSKTAIFEGAGAKKDAGESVELRPRGRREACEKRHTFENREREPETVDLTNRRVSLDPKPLRSIKDMKTIFESKSHQ